MHDVLNQAFRKQVIQEIEGDENRRRKADHQKRQDIFNNKQRKYVLDMLVKEFSESTVRDMRTCTSINLVKRIIGEQASIYKSEPKREVAGLSDQQKAQLASLYDSAEANKKLKSLNQKYKLHEQAFMQVIPKHGGIKLRCLAPHQLDVVPSLEDPEVGEIFIVSGYDKANIVAELDGNEDIQGNGYGSKNQHDQDGVNQAIADQDDYRKAKVYAWWTAEYNFLTDSSGAILPGQPSIENPIQMLPFIEAASEKDQEFWCDGGSGVVEFNLDFSVVLSDTCNTNRLQSYAQAVITGEKLPENITVGPNNILFLPLDSTKPELKPSFEFVSPNPNMEASIDLQDRLLSYFLTSEGIDPKTISGKAEGEKYASGLERLLATIEKFEASQDDYALFRKIESKLYTLIAAWSNALQGTDALPPKLQGGELPIDAELTVQFCKPEFIKTAAEAEDSVIKRMEAGLISRKEAIMELRGVDEEKAEEILAELDEEENEPAEDSKEDMTEDSEEDPVDTEQEEMQQ